LTKPRKVYNDLDNLRSKLQRESILRHGMANFQLWSLALRLNSAMRSVHSANAIRFSPKPSPLDPTPKKENAPPFPSRTASLNNDAITMQNFPPLGARTSKSARQASWPSTPSNSKSALRSSGSIDKTQSKGVNWDLPGAGSAKGPSSTEDSPTEQKTSLRSVDKKEPLNSPKASGTRQYRDSTLPGGLPVRIWVAILRDTGMATSGILSDAQCAAIVKHAFSKTTLHRRADLRGKDTPTQQLHMLAEMKCLEYDMAEAV
jgi:hypothetical protein